MGPIVQHSAGDRNLTQVSSSEEVPAEKIMKILGLEE